MQIDPIERMNLAFSAGAVAVSAVLATPLFAFSVAIGAALEAFNFRGLRRQSQFLFWGQIKSGGLWTGVYGLRFGALVIGICSALYFGADPAGLLVGLSIIMPAVVVEAWRTRPRIDPTAPALSPDDEAWERWNPWLVREEEPNEAEDEYEELDT
ncbi:MAG: hypothetical protein IIA30_09830 [Myxococcales bacterium]|nr:hypothetical protein [Myxococcales bacterium]